MTGSPATDVDEENEQQGSFGTLGSSMRLFVLAWAAVIASFPLNDNSFFTHLATGRIILDDRSVPSSDPYTFTAPGEDWTVQSWFASVAYAGAERVGGAVGLRLLVLGVFLVAALLLWRVSAAAESLFPRLVIVFGAMFVFTGLWSERPLMIGVIGLGVVWLALDGAVRPVLLVPLLWVWANTHGSFPLAFVLIGAVIAGEALDGRKARGRGESDRGGRDRIGTELAVLKYTALGTLLAAIGPLGLDVLLFPLKTFSRSDLLSEVIEWQPPAYRSLAERAFLVLVLLTFAAIARHGRWRIALPALVFIGASLYAQRNIVMATMVLVPVLAACAPRLGTLTGRTRPGIGSAFTAVCAVAVVLASVLVVTGPAFSGGRYPVTPLAWLDSTDALDGGTRLATQDRVGNFIEVLDGPRGAVFIDDRADMFPAEVFADYLVLLRGEPEWASVLEEHQIDAVLWERSRPLASLLSADRRWRTVFSDGTWTISCRRGQPVCEDLTA